jgi:hypothetical protein
VANHKEILTMKKTIEICFDEFFLDKRTCESIKERLSGKTYLEFQIGYSNCYGNCNLVVWSEKATSKKQLKSMFMGCVFDLAGEQKQKEA